ncbi:hypothetical protein [Nocardiopsis prasina]|uniref:hypothetical protein n=1 Tax=Nocardiopsis prasina TaxID=2015 RepID=UPI000370219E|nr:hypothetical protein [Nocardiopsis prasina]
MLIYSVILLLIMMASAALTAAHAFHRRRVRTSGVHVPDMDDLKRLEKDLERIQEDRNSVARADGSLGGRIRALQSAAREIGREDEGLSSDYVTKTLLEVRELSESAAAPHLADPTSQ